MHSRKLFFQYLENCIVTNGLKDYRIDFYRELYWFLYVYLLTKRQECTASKQRNSLAWHRHPTPRVKCYNKTLGKNQWKNKKLIICSEIQSTVPYVFVRDGEPVNNSECVWRGTKKVTIDGGKRDCCLPTSVVAEINIFFVTQRKALNISTLRYLFQWTVSPELHLSRSTDNLIMYKLESAL